MTFAVIGGLAGAAAGAFGVGGLTLATGAGLGLAAGSALGSLTGTDASSRAASTQAAAANEAAALQRQTAQEQLALQKRMYEENIARQKPYYEAGVNALAQLQGKTGAMPATFQYRPDQLTNDPGYAFRLSEGQKALERSAAARGGLLSGGTGKALTRYGQEMASQEYGNAYNRALTEYNAARARESEGYNRLAGLAGVGGTTAQQIGAAGQTYAGAAGNIMGNMASNVGEAYQGAANARASGYVGSANALSNLVGQGVNYYQNQQLMNRLFPSSGSSYGPVYGQQPLGASFAPYLTE